MKIVFSAVIALTGIGFLEGCVSTGVSRASSIAGKMQDTEMAIQTARDQIDVTLKALDDVNAQAQGDPTAAYESFVDAVGDLESGAHKIAARADTMNARLDAHFFAWQQEIQAISSPDVRAVSESRRQDALKKYRAVAGDLKAAREKLDAAVTALKDLKIAMSTDLNAAGIHALADLMSKATRDCRSVQEDLGDLVEAIGKLRQSMSVNKPQPAMEEASP